MLLAESAGNAARQVGIQFNLNRAQMLSVDVKVITRLKMKEM